MSRLKNLLAVTSFSLVLGIANSASAQDDQDIDKLLNSSMKDVTSMEVTSVSKRAEKASEAAAAIYVITAEDIRRSGFNSVPEVLRMVPGVQVSRINSSWWAITARGNAEAFGNKLLVLIDGRSIYNPLFSGVLWEEQGTPLENIERIEVIRGPGSTLYGANAVNGVINIITKNSKDTQGTEVSAGAGTYDKLSGFARYGGKLANNDTYRTYVSQYNQGPSYEYGGNHTYDGFDMTRTGMRYDGSLNNNSTYMISSDFYKGQRDVPFTRVPAVNAFGFVDGRDTHDLFGGNIIGKYSKSLDSGANVDLQVYYDFVGRDGDIFGNRIQTLDFDGQETKDLSEHHQFIWGLGYRLVHSDWDQSDTNFYSDKNDVLNTNLFSGFAQDKIALVQDELYLTLGSKVEHNSFTGFEVEPNARLTWLPTQTQTVWGAITRAVRTPSPTDRDLTQEVQGSPFGLAAIKGNSEFNSEKLIAYELGYRNQLTKDLSLDVSTFINDYQSLRTFELGGVSALPIVQTLEPKNKGYGMSRGIEISSNYQVTKYWGLTGSYSYLDMNIKTDDGSTDVLGKSEDGQSPSNMFNIRSHIKFSDQWETDESIYYVDRIHGALGDTRDIKDYVSFDARIGYKPMENVELSLVGQNLLDNRHPEFGSAIYSQPAEIPRSVFAKATIRF